MFKKKPQIKPLSPLRSSDRRKIADQIISDLGLSKVVSEDASEEEKTAATAEHTTLRNSLLPENALSARFTTTHGPDLKQVSGTVFVGDYEGGDQRILWFKIHDRMYPSVYTLWKNPGIIPLIHTHPFVMEKLQGGADLMTPGLTYGPPFPEKAIKGAIVTVADTGRPTVPIMVGSCEIDVSRLKQVQGAKGHAVENVHWAGDELWSWSASSKSGTNPPQDIPGWNKQAEDVERDDLAANTDNLRLDSDGEHEGGVSLTGNGQQPVEISPAQDDTGPDNDDDAANSPEATGREFSVKEIDEAFRKAFLYGVYHHTKTHPGPTYGLTFPLNQSFVMSNLVQPFLPAFTPEEASQLQIKKSGFKNIKKFIRSLDKEQIIKSKERDGNEVVIFDIDFNDRSIKDFVPYKLPKKETMASTSAGRGDLATTTPKGSTGPLKIHVMYKPKDKLSPLFEAAKADPRGFYSQPDLSTVVSAYITAENLVSETNKRIVKLDPFLANTIFDDGKSAQDKEILARGTVPRDTLITRVVAQCAPYHQISTAGEETSRPKAGAPPKITIILETRSGNKTVTKVSGLEAFSILPQPLADELRKACAGSTSVEKLVGSAAKNPVLEVMVQGPQKDAVIKALEKRGVDKRWVEVVDKTKKKK